MKKLLLFLILIITSNSIFGQEDKYWYPFLVEDFVKNPLSSSLGFKDIKGNILIEPIYIAPFTQNVRFEKIVALSEYSKKEPRNYYLNKKGKKFGIDSLYTFDFAHDTEQEGFIRFSVGKNLDSIGLFNSDGKIVIKPKFNTLSRVNNGLVVARIGASQIHEKHNSGCDHWHYEGGKEVLMDTLGNILIDDFKDNNLDLNLFTLKITNERFDENFRHFFIGTDNKYYSFISSKEEFSDFINNEFLENVSNKTLKSYLFVNLENTSNQNLLEIENIINILKNNKFKLEYYDTDFSIDLEDKQLYKLVEKILNNENELNYSKYPTFSVYCENPMTRKKDILSFIRTESGYKLFEFSSQKVY